MTARCPTLDNKGGVFIVFRIVGSRFLTLLTYFTSPELGYKVISAVMNWSLVGILFRKIITETVCFMSQSRLLFCLLCNINFEFTV